MATGGHEEFHGISGVPKLGTVVPNRIFVGGISGSTNDEDLRCLFAKFGRIKATKIILDRAGISKGFGFVTFETVEEAQKVLEQVECVTLKERKLNIAPAVKKQPYSRVIESSPIHSGPYIWPAPPSFTGSSGYPSRDSVYYPQATWPLVWPQQFFQQQCHYAPVPQAACPQYIYSVAPPEYPFPPVNHLFTGSDSETSSADGTEATLNHPKQAVSTPTSPYAISQSKASATNASRFTACGHVEGHSHSPAQFQHFQHVLAKTVNGVAVMAYPSSLVMGSPTILHVKDPNSDADNVVTELELLQSSIAPGGPTPPPTPHAQIPCDFGFNASLEARKN